MSRRHPEACAQDSILRKPVAELRKSSLIKQKGEQTPPPEKKSDDEVEELPEESVLVVDESQIEETKPPDKADSSSSSSNHIDSSTKEKKSNKKPSVVNSGNSIKGQRHERLSNEKGVNGHNNELKKAIIKEVRKPGKDFTKLFEGLENIKGDLDTKYLFVNAIIYEASRFKRRVLIKKLELFQRHMIAQEESTGNKKATKKRARNHYSVDQNYSHKAKKAKPR